MIHRDLAPSSVNGRVDCDCDCSHSLSYGHPVRLTTLGEASDKGNWQITPGLYRAPLDEKHELFFNPLSQVGVLVLSRKACRLLDAFRDPQTLSAVLRFSDYETYVWKQRLIGQFVAFELLSRPGYRSAFRPGASQTLAAWMHVTNDCNLRCAYCYLNKTAEDMSLEVGRRTVDMIFTTAQRYSFRMVKFKFSGGEATLNLPLVFDLNAYAQEKAEVSGVELQSVILSNGIAISRRTARALKEADIRVMISLDGVGEYHDAQRSFSNGYGSFHLVDRAIHRLLEVGLPPNISVTISKRNLEGLPDLIDYVLDHDLPFSLSLYRENDCSVSFRDLKFSEQRIVEKMLAVFRQIEHRLPERSLLSSLIDKASFIAPHDKTCGVGSNYMVINQYGQIAKCQMEIERPVTTIFTDDPLAVIQKDQTSIQNISVDEKEGCRDCTWRYWCAGGCPVHTYRATGRYDIKSPNCIIYKALFPAVLRLEGLRLLKYGQRVVGW